MPNDVELNRICDICIILYNLSSGCRTCDQHCNRGAWRMSMFRFLVYLKSGKLLKFYAAMYFLSAVGSLFVFETVAWNWLSYKQEAVSFKLNTFCCMCIYVVEFYQFLTGLFITIGLLEWLGRRRTIALEFFIFSIFVFLVNICITRY